MIVTCCCNIFRGQNYCSLSLQIAPNN